MQGKMTEDGKEEEEEEEEDTELCGIQLLTLHQGECLPLWKAHNNWLKLMVIYFDAV